MNNLLENNEEGYAIVLAIMMLGIMMLAGILTSNTAITDLSSVRNSILSAQNAAAADSVAMLAAQKLENENDKEQLYTSSTTWTWLDSFGTIPANADENSATYNGYWAEIDSSTLNKLDKLKGRLLSENAKLRYRVIGWTAAQGTSMGAYAPTLKESRIRAQYISQTGGIYSVEMGFKKRF